MVTSPSDTCIYNLACCYVLLSRLALFHCKANMIFNQMCFDKSGVTFIFIHCIFLFYFDILEDISQIFSIYRLYTFKLLCTFISLGKCWFLLYLHCTVQLNIKSMYADGLLHSLFFIWSDTSYIWFVLELNDSWIDFEIL